MKGECGFRIKLRQSNHTSAGSSCDLSISKHLPPMTFVSPLKTFVRLLTTMSAIGRTSTFANVPIVSSMTIMNPCLSAKARKRFRSAERKSGLDGNSVKSARTGVPCSSSCSRASKSASVP